MKGGNIQGPNLSQRTKDNKGMWRMRKIYFLKEDVLIGYQVPSGQSWNNIYTNNIIRTTQIAFMYMYVVTI